MAAQIRFYPSVRARGKRAKHLTSLLLNTFPTPPDPPSTPASSAAIRFSTKPISSFASSPAEGIRRASRGVDVPVAQAGDGILLMTREDGGQFGVGRIVSQRPVASQQGASFG